MITQEQREERRHYLGASDAAAVVGCDPFRNAADVYYSKISEAVDEPNEAMQIGNRMEPVLLDLAEERYGPIRRNVSIGRTAPHSPLAANLDGLELDQNEVIECKYVGPKGAGFWGEQGTADVPDHVALQVQHQMYCAKSQYARVVAAIVRPYVGLRFEFFAVPRDDDLIDTLIPAELAFWKNHVVPRVPPANIAPSLEILKRIRRLPDTIDLDGLPAADFIEQWEAAKAAVKESEAKADYCYQHVLALLGDAEAGTLADGRILQYCEENAGLRLADTKAAQKSNPDLFIPTTRRVLRVKKGKKSK